MLAEVRYPDGPVKHCHVAVRMTRHGAHDTNVTRLMHIMARRHLDEAHCQQTTTVIFGGNVVLELDSSCLDGYTGIVRAKPKA